MNNVIPFKPKQIMDPASPVHEVNDFTMSFKHCPSAARRIQIDTDEQNNAIRT